MVENVRVEHAGSVTTVILDRPATRNAVDASTAAALSEAFLEFERDDSSHVAVLWGHGGTFCSGADLKAIAAGRTNRLTPPVAGPDWRPHDGSAPMGPTRLRLSKPVIAAVEGHAVAGGLELAIWCDLRVAAADAVFGVFCRRWGVPLIDGGTVRLPRLVGLSRALDMIITGRPVDAEEALAIGLVNRVVPKGDARRAAEELAHRIAAFPQQCLRSDRLAALEQLGLHEADALANEFARGLQVLANGEADVGAGRFTGGAGRGGSFET